MKHSYIILMILFIFLTPCFSHSSNLKNADMDGDGYITCNDLKILGQHMNTHAAAYKGDVNGDGKINNYDLTTLARVLLSRGAGIKNSISPKNLGNFISYVVKGKSSGNSGSDNNNNFDSIINKIDNNKGNLTSDSKTDIDSKSRLKTPFEYPFNTNYMGKTPVTPQEELSEYLKNIKSANKPENVESSNGITISDINEKRNKTTGSLENRNFEDVFSDTVGNSVKDFKLTENFNPGSTIYNSAPPKNTRDADGDSFYNNPNKQAVLDDNTNQIMFTDIHDGSHESAGEHIGVYEIPENFNPIIPVTETAKTAGGDDLEFNTILESIQEGQYERFFNHFRNGEGIIENRSEMFSKLFSGQIAEDILKNNGASLGLDPNSNLVQDYANIADKFLTDAVSQGIITSETSARARREINEVINPPVQVATADTTGNTMTKGENTNIDGSISGTSGNITEYTGNSVNKTNSTSGTLDNESEVTGVSSNSGVYLDNNGNIIRPNAPKSEKSTYSDFKKADYSSYSDKDSISKTDKLNTKKDKMIGSTGIGTGISSGASIGAGIGAKAKADATKTTTDTGEESGGIWDSIKSGASGAYDWVADNAGTIATGAATGAAAGALGGPLGMVTGAVGGAVAGGVVAYNSNDDPPAKTGN